jgi:hypothetical protein
MFRKGCAIVTSLIQVSHRFPEYVLTVAGRLRKPVTIRECAAIWRGNPWDRGTPQPWSTTVTSRSPLAGSSNSTDKVREKPGQRLQGTRTQADRPFSRRGRDRPVRCRASRQADTGSAGQASGEMQLDQDVRQRACAARGDGDQQSGGVSDSQAGTPGSQGCDGGCPCARA